MPVDALIASEPTPGQRIDELHCWISTFADGTEGIVGYNLFPGGGPTPLVTSRRHAAERMESLANRAAAASQQTDHPVTVRLVTYTRKAES